jgi:hypothetical protein
VDRSSRPIRITHSGELLRQDVSEILESVSELQVPLRGKTMLNPIAIASAMAASSSQMAPSSPAL